MRIRNRSSSAVLSSRGSWEKKEGNRRITDEVENKEQKFHLPLVAAAMDSQQTQDDDDQLDDSIPGSGTGMRKGTDWCRGHKWTDILLRCRAGNAKSCAAIKVDSLEGEITKFKGKKIMSNKGDKIGFLENEGKGQGVFGKEHASSSCVKAGTARDYRKYGSPKSGLFETDFMSREPEDEQLVESGDVYTIDLNKRKRTRKNRNSRDENESINAWRSGDKKSFTISEEEEIIRKDKPKVLEKPMANSNNDNSHMGSQCRRRNGRGWRCSQRTLVGYSLCEHHLGKGRLKSINTANDTVLINNNKGSKFKELRMLDASSSYYCKVEIDHHDKKSQKRALKLIS